MVCVMLSLVGNLHPPESFVPALPEGAESPTPLSASICHHLVSQGSLQSVFPSARGLIPEECAPGAQPGTGAPSPELQEEFLGIQ